MLSHLLGLLLIPSAAFSAPAEKAQKYVNCDIRSSLTNYFDITDYSLGIQLNVSSLGNSLHFNGRPFSGSVYKNGNFATISGGGVNGNANKFGNGYSVNATVYEPGQPSRYLNFTLRANGPLEDPNYSPSFSLFSGDANLQFYPSFGGREYRVSGSVDEQRFGAAGTAVAALVVTTYMSERKPKDKALPDAQWLEKSPTALPVLLKGVVPLR
ncbi:MAG: hypothetical protein WC728_15520 [Elusimicrobiota bacterium]